MVINLNTEYNNVGKSDSDAKAEIPLNTHQKLHKRFYENKKAKLMDEKAEKLTREKRWERKTKSKPYFA
ncbi:hypothetical protein Anapl_07138 [Anas platyrhynchos]|uniref:Uncharacterized protein n=1 Tax=Anas platyrhynchos TaxID=8839 RepID=R0L0Z8_ANAPL|nr:hypothetical protein Anapl_07138 [Anas platyrhynchos]